MSPTISCTSVYKIFGESSQKLLSENKGKVDAAKFQEAGCIVGVNNASFDVNDTFLKSSIIFVLVLINYNANI